MKKSKDKLGLQHLVGAGVIALGTYGIAKWMIHRHHEQVAAQLQQLHAQAAATHAQLAAVRGYYS